MRLSNSYRSRVNVHLLNQRSRVQKLTTSRAALLVLHIHHTVQIKMAISIKQKTNSTQNVTPHVEGYTFGTNRGHRAHVFRMIRFLQL